MLMDHAFEGLNESFRTYSRTGHGRSWRKGLYLESKTRGDIKDIKDSWQFVVFDEQNLSSWSVGGSGKEK